MFYIKIIDEMQRKITLIDLKGEFTPFSILRVKSTDTSSFNIGVIACWVVYFSFKCLYVLT